MSNFEIKNNTQQQQFEVHIEGEIAELVYRFYKDDIALMHTQVPENMEGRGIASALAKHALDWAKAQHKKVMVYCPFVASYIKRHPEYDELVDKTYSS